MTQVVFGSPVTRPEKDPDLTEPGPDKTANTQDQWRLETAVWFTVHQKIDISKTEQRPVSSVSTGLLPFSCSCICISIINPRICNY